MSLIVLMGPQAVGKMTVGRVLAQKIEGRLLYNHQTLDVFAEMLGYRQAAFDLSDQLRKMLFKAFAEEPEKNPTKHLVFTLVIDFDDKKDWQFLKDIEKIFVRKKQAVYFIELESPLAIRLERNKGADRLAAKPSKRDLIQSEKELMASHQKQRLNSETGEFIKKFPKSPYLKIANGELSPEETVDIILNQFIFE